MRRWDDMRILASPWSPSPSFPPFVLSLFSFSPPGVSSLGESAFEAETMSASSPR